MNYIKINREDMTNGEGLRLSLFVSGCSHGCKGCYNTAAFNPKAGIPFTDETMSQVLGSLAEHDGLSLLGGDPLYPRNREGITRLCKAAKEMYPEKDIWLWTGYTHADVADLEVMQYIDVLIDGRYEQDKPTTKPWRGSDNQRLIHIQEI